MITRFVGGANQSIFFVLRDKTTGEFLTALTFADVTLAYKIDATGVSTSVTPVTLANDEAAHTDGGFVEVDATKQPGLYRADFPDDAFASGRSGVATCVPDVDPNFAEHQEYELVYDITPSAGNLLDVNVKRIDDDATAAANAEAFFDGTGYAGTNNVIPTVTTLTNAPSDPSGVTTLLSRLTSARAGYLDNLNGSSLPDIETIVAAILVIANKLDDTLEDDGGTYRFTENSLEEAPSGGGGGGATAEEIAQAVWDLATASANASGSFGELVQSLSSSTASEIVTALLADTSIEDGKSLRGILQAMLAVLCGVTGAPGVQRTFMNPSNTTARVTTTTPGDGSRTVVTLNVS